MNENQLNQLCSVTSDLCDFEDAFLDLIFKGPERPFYICEIDAWSQRLEELCHKLLDVIAQEDPEYYDNWQESRFEMRGEKNEFI